nr:hypothetical protein [Conexibacter sp. W3-3-2]
MTVPAKAGLTHITHEIGMSAAAAASTAALIDWASIETSTIASYFSWTACWTKPACLAGVNSPSKIGDGVQPIALAAAWTSFAPCRQLMPALPQLMTATFPVPGSNGSSGCGNSTPVSFVYFATSAAASPPAVSGDAACVVVSPDDAGVLLLSSSSPHPAAKTSAASAAPSAARPRNVEPI